MQTKPSTPRAFQVVELGVGERGDVFARAPEDQPVGGVARFAGRIREIS